MKRAVWWTCALLVLAHPDAHARIYNRCELARDLRSLSVHPDHISTWVCIAYHESRFDTAANNPHSGDHGIFQISELYWCGAGKACGLPCSALRDDDIADDLECALQVHEEHTRLQGDGFFAWVVYPQHCKQNTKKYLIDCDESFKNTSTLNEGRAFRTDYRTKVTDRTYPKNPNIDNLLPPYLAITSIFRGSYGKVLDHNEINGVDWFNYKYDKVDELRIPEFMPGVGKTPTSTTSTSTTTTTTSTYVPPIKPWRFIESNQFRKKKVYSDRNAITETSSETYFKPTTESTTHKSFITSADISQIKTTITAYKSPVTLTPTIKPVNSTNTAYKWPEVTASYKSRSATYRPSTITYGFSTGSTNNSLTSTTGYKFMSSTTTVRPTIAPFVFTFPTTTVRPTTVSTTLFKFPPQKFTSRYRDFSSTSKPTISSTKSSWYTFAPRAISGSTTTLSTTPQYFRSTTTPRYRQSTKSLVTSTTLRPSSTTTVYSSESQTKTNSFFTSSKPPLFTGSTTQKYSYFTATTQKPTFLSTTTTQKPNFFTSTTTQKPNTQKTSTGTQNIFDLYLNPTKPPKLPPFSFSSRDNSRFKLNIFSGGTTTISTLANNNIVKQTRNDRNRNERDTTV